MQETRSSVFPTTTNINRPEQLQKMARSLKFRLKEEEELFYPCSENKGADQLCDYCTADLCFRIGKKPVFSCRGSYEQWVVIKNINKSDSITSSVS